MRYCLQYNNDNNNNTIITLRRGGDCRFFENEETVGMAVTYTTYLHLAGGIIAVTRRRRDEALECIFEACQQSSSRKYTLPRALLLYSKYIYMDLSIPRGHVYLIGTYYFLSRQQVHTIFKCCTNEKMKKKH